MSENSPYILTGARNFRALNGYRNNSGQQIKQGVLYRSGALAHASEAALKQIREHINLGCVVDLRRPNERELNPNPDVGADVLMNVCVVTDDSQFLWDGFLNKTLKAQECEDFMLRYYRLLVREPAAEGYRSIIAKLVEGDGPMLFHCSAGKDRTGYFAAILKMALGFSDDVVMQDFMLSNKVIEASGDMQAMRERKEIPEDVDWNAIAPLLRVKDSYLLASLDEMRLISGSAQNYLREVMQIDEQTRSALNNVLCTS